MNPLVNGKFLYPIRGVLGSFDEIRTGGYHSNSFKAADEETPLYGPYKETYDPIYGPHDEARECKREMETGKGALAHWIRNNLVYVEIVTVHVRREYAVVTWLTDDGEACFQALQGGMAWSIAGKCPAIAETIAYYERELDHAQIDDTFFKAVWKLPSPQFDTLISSFVFRKLQSEQVAGRPELWKKVA